MQYYTCNVMSYKAGLSAKQTDNNISELCKQGRRTTGHRLCLVRNSYVSTHLIYITIIISFVYVCMYVCIYIYIYKHT